jgi:hypothetical protein
LPRVWSHCWETAYLAQHLCRQKRLPAGRPRRPFWPGCCTRRADSFWSITFPGQFAAACQGARQLKSPLAPRLLETFQTTPAQLTAYLMELWGMPAEVVTAISFQDNPQQEPGGAFSLTSALYVADHIAARKAPPDDFAAWKNGTWTYLRTIGCQDDFRSGRIHHSRSTAARNIDPKLAARKGLNWRRGADFICPDMLAGTYTAIVTPFRNGQFDAPAFKRLIDMQVKGGVDGIVPVGTTGESPTLDYKEHIEVIAHAVEYAAGRIHVMAGTGGNSTSEAVYLTQEAEKAGADSSLQVAPYYNKPTPGGIVPAFPGSQPRHQTAAGPLQRSFALRRRDRRGDRPAPGGRDAPRWSASRKPAATPTA